MTNELSRLKRFAQQYSVRTALCVLGALGAFHTGRALILGVNESTFDAPLVHGATNAGEASRSAFLYMMQLNLDIAFPFCCFMIYAALRGSSNFAAALAPVTAWACATDFIWHERIASVPDLEETARSKAFQNIVVISILMLVFLFAPAVHRVARASALERRFLHLFGYVVMATTVCMAVLPHSRTMFGALASTSAVNSAIHLMLLSNVHWDALQALTVAHFGDEQDALAFYVASIARCVFSGITIVLAFDWAPASAFRLAVQVVVGAIYIFFVVKRVRADDNSHSKRN